MIKLTPTGNKEQWPRKAVKSVDCRKKDLVVRITDWTRDRDEPAYDVEIYVGGAYDFNLSRTFPTRNANQTKAQAKASASAFASQQIATLL